MCDELVADESTETLSSSSPSIVVVVVGRPASFEGGIITGQNDDDDDDDDGGAKTYSFVLGVTHKKEFFLLFFMCVCFPHNNFFVFSF